MCSVCSVYARGGGWTAESIPSRNTTGSVVRGPSNCEAVPLTAISTICMVARIRLTDSNDSSTELPFNGHRSKVLHATHSVAFSLGLRVPGTHGLHRSAPLTGFDVPCGHAMHVVTSVMDELVPGGQAS